MTGASDWKAVAAALAGVAGRGVAPAPERPVGGGGIHAAWRWPVGAGSVFVKLAPAARASEFEAEADALAALASADAVRVPTVLGHGLAGEHAWLALEWLDLVPPDARSEGELGARLADLHRACAERHGWRTDNYIGRSPQPNGWCADWVEFLRERRLRPQLDGVDEAPGADAALCTALRERGARLLDAVDVFYASYRPVPSLLHGDLWSGNRGALTGGIPVVFDPASYYGDREADLAMARLFGGFSPRFHAAYQSAWPLDAAAGYRRELHNLYHVLNHHRLFGGGYGAQALAMMERLLAEAGR